MLKKYVDMFIHISRYRDWKHEYFFVPWTDFSWFDLLCPDLNSLLHWLNLYFIPSWIFLMWHFKLLFKENCLPQNLQLNFIPLWILSSCALRLSFVEKFELQIKHVNSCFNSIIAIIFISANHNKYTYNLNETSLYLLSVIWLTNGRTIVM